jgi:hypothetical protein
MHLTTARTTWPSARCTFLPMVRWGDAAQDASMARTAVCKPSRLAETDGESAPPAVVCALNGSPPGRAAAAYAAALARALGWRLGLVASGLRPLDLPLLSAAVVEDRAGIVVQPSHPCVIAREAGELARTAGVPVVIVPTDWREEAESEGPIVAVAGGATPGLIAVATRLALAIGAPLEVVHVREDCPHLSVRSHDAHRPRLLVRPADDATRISQRDVAQPVMFVPCDHTPNLELAA